MSSAIGPFAYPVHLFYTQHRVDSAQQRTLAGVGCRDCLQIICIKNISSFWWPQDLAITNSP